MRQTDPGTMEKRRAKRLRAEMLIERVAEDRRLREDPIYSFKVAVWRNRPEWKPYRDGEVFKCQFCDKDAVECMGQKPRKDLRLCQEHISECLNVYYQNVKR